MERRHTQTEVRAEENRITGYASVFYDGTPQTEYELWKGAVERIDRRAFDRAIQEEHDVRALYNHDADNLLGRTPNTLSLSVDKRGLKYEVKYDPTDPTHQSVFAKIKRGDLSGSSFAFRVTGESWAEEEGREVRTVTDVQLIDVGPVVFPAYAGSTTGLRSIDSDTEARSSHQQWKAKQETDKRMKNFEARHAI